jgi:methionyl-tRNA formyltransferase
VSKNLKIIFMGTPDFAAKALRALHQSDHEVICVYTQPPRAKGRGQQVQKSPVHQYAEEHRIEVRDPKSLRNKDAETGFAALKADVAVVAAYGLLLPWEILAAPKYGCINIHASLLPRWRGASPIQHAILAGDKETGITIMQMDKGLDTGPMIVKELLPITPQSTTTSLHDELADLGAKMIVETLNKLAAERGLKATEQDDKDSTYAGLLRKGDGQVDWHKSAEEIGRKVRALNPWPGVWTEFSGKRMKILEAVPQDAPFSEIPGTILSREGEIACGNGVLKIHKIQPEGKSAMDFGSAVNGGYVNIGEHFS